MMLNLQASPMDLLTELPKVLLFHTGTGKYPDVPPEVLFQPDVGLYCRSKVKLV